jgi:hypothetical protein
MTDKNDEATADLRREVMPTLARLLDNADANSNDEEITGATACLRQAVATYEDAERCQKAAADELGNLDKRQVELGNEAARLLEELKAARESALNDLIAGVPVGSSEPAARLRDLEHQHTLLLTAVEQIAVFRRPDAKRRLLIAERILADAASEVFSAQADLHYLKQARRLAQAAVHAGGSLRVEDPMLDAYRARAAELGQQAKVIDRQIVEHDARVADMRAARAASKKF